MLAIGSTRLHLFHLRLDVKEHYFKSLLVAGGRPRCLMGEIQEQHGYYTALRTSSRFMRWFLIFFGGVGDYRSVCRVLETHGKGSFTHGKAFAAFGVCCTRQTAIDKEVLCRVQFIGHTTESLPITKMHSAKFFQKIN